MKKRILLFIACVLPLFLAAQQFPERPSPPRLVNDFTGTLTASETGALESKLVAYNDSTSTQIAVVMLSSLDGYPIEDYAFELGERWGVGQKGKNNGVVVLIAKDDRKVFIATGYGMEGVMPDGLVKRIVENDIKPAFRAGDYYGGIDRATDSMIRLAAGEYQAEPQGQKDQPPPVLFIILFLLFMTLFMIFKARSVRKYANVNSIPFWTAWMLLNQARKAHRGTWGGFSGRSGGWGGGGGGGFGGFGGGSFGGGGAGGSW